MKTRKPKNQSWASMRWTDLLFQTEFPENELAQRILDFVVSGYRGVLSGYRISVNIMLSFASLE